MSGPAAAVLLIAFLLFILAALMWFAHRHGGDT